MIKAENISAALSGRMVLSGLSCCWQSGGLHCIIGPNGAGKTTLLKAALGMVPVSEGRIEYDGIPLSELSLSQRALKAAYLPQSRPVMQMTVQRLVELGRFPHRGFMASSDKAAKQAVSEALERTGCKELAGRYLTGLSGGELQRVYIAMAIAQQTEALFLDEPVSALDLRYQTEILTLLKELAKEGKNIIMVIHDLQQAFTYGDDVSLLYGGKVYACSGEGAEEGLSLIPRAFGAGIKQDERPDSLYSYRLVK